MGGALSFPKLVCWPPGTKTRRFVPGKRIERRLAAVVAADVEGYSRLMSADEVGTLAVLKSLRREVVDPIIAAHYGRIVKTTGDGMLIEFASAVDAVTCALVLQDQMRAGSGRTEPKITFRIGINVGDIIVQGSDIFGDGVNVAARVENECEPGGVCLSGSAFEQVRGKPDSPSTISARGHCGILTDRCGFMGRVLPG